MAKYFVYVLQCADKSYYVGFTSNLNERIAKHNSGQGAKWTAHRLPVVLMYSEECESEQAAVSREKQLKGWSRAKKEALVREDMASLKSLSKSKQEA